MATMARHFLIVLVAFIAANAAASEVPKPVHTARQAEEIAAKHSPANSPDADPKNWLATYDPKSKTWSACAGRPTSSPQSGFCERIDATTGKVSGIDILN
jgi:hypothetical protein